MTIHDFVARDDIGADVETVRKASPWGVAAVVIATVGFWAYVFALAHAVL